MNDPDVSILVIKIIIIVFGGLVIPQALCAAGVIWSKNKRIFLKIITMLIAPLSFWLISSLFFRFWAGSIKQTGNYACGAFGAAATFSTIFGTLINLAISILIFALLNWYWKKHNNNKQHN